MDSMLSARSTRTVAVVMACHNRKALTLKCLESVFRQSTRHEIKVFLTDDGSTDGTPEAVALKFPSVRVLPGDGELYWCGGMRRSISAAASEQPDFFLWLNDDVYLEEMAISGLVACHESLSSPDAEEPIVVGSVWDSERNEISYSGVKRRSVFHPLKFEKVAPGPTPRPCHTMNGNVTLVPLKVQETVKLDARFRHRIADFDFGLRAHSLGHAIWLMPGYAGTCKINTSAVSLNDATLGLRERWTRFCSFRNLDPKEWALYCRRHGGLLWPIRWMMPYVRFLLMEPVRQYHLRRGEKRPSRP